MKFIKCIHVSCSHTDILLFQLVKLITFLFENITLTTVSTVTLPVALNIHLLSSVSSVLSVFVVDTSLSSEALLQPEVSFTLKVSNPMLINF